MQSDDNSIKKLTYAAEQAFGSRWSAAEQFGSKPVVAFGKQSVVVGAVACTQLRVAVVLKR